MVSPRFRDKAVSSNTGHVEKVLSLLSMQLLHKATRTDTDDLQQKLQQQNMMNMMMMSILASLLNDGVPQTTTSTDSADPIQAMMSSIIALKANFSVEGLIISKSFVNIGKMCVLLSPPSSSVFLNQMKFIL